jgi:uncharacterized protein DUF559/putative AbiEi antitoxin of type IV toxin-antitoxin system
MSWKGNRASGKGGRDWPLSELVGPQDGVASLGQLRDIGLSQRTVEYRATQGRLHRVHRGVYAVGHLSIGQLGALRAAVLACGDGAVISHGTAAAFYDLRNQWPALIDVTGGRQAGRKLDGIRCRRCRYPTPEEIVVHDGIPFTSPARVLVDSAGMLGTPSLRRMVERTAVRRLLDLEAVDLAMGQAKRRRGIRALRMILEDWRTDDGSVPDLRSEFEALVLPRLVAMGLPRPACNETLSLDGERLMVDFLWKRQRVVAETDGEGTHGTPIAFQRDRRRDQILAAAGYRVSRTTWAQMRDEPEAVVQRIARTLLQAES